MGASSLQNVRKELAPMVRSYKCVGYATLP